MNTPNWRAPQRKVTPQLMTRAAIIAGAVALVVVVVLVIVRPWASSTDDQKAAVNDRIAALQAAQFIEVEGTTERGDGYTALIGDDGIVVGEMTLGTAAAPFVRTNTDAYVEGSPNVWGRMDFDGEYEGWAHLSSDAPDILPDPDPAITEVYARVRDGSPSLTGDGYLQYSGGVQVRASGDDLLVRTRGGDYTTTYRPLGGDPLNQVEAEAVFDTTVASAVGAVGRIVDSSAGVRVDGPPPFEGEHEELPPPPPED